MDEMFSLRKGLNFDISKLSFEEAQSWSSNDKKRWGWNHLFYVFCMRLKCTLPPFVLNSYADLTVIMTLDKHRVHFVASPRTHTFSFWISFLATRLKFYNVFCNTHCHVIHCTIMWLSKHARVVDKICPGMRGWVLISENLHLGFPRSRISEIFSFF